MSDTQHTPLWSDEKITWHADSVAANAGQSYRLFVSMRKMRDDYEAALAAANQRIAELEAQLAETWQPLPDGEYSQRWAGSTTILHVFANGVELEQWNLKDTYKDGSPRHVDEISLGEFRLCRQAQAQNTNA